MKKLLLLVICCLVLFTGCGKKEERAWYLDFETNGFDWEGSGDMIYAVGTIKNKSGKKCKSVEIKLKYRREDFERDDICWEWPDFEDGESFKAECLYTDDSKDLIKNYSITVDNIRCRDDDLK